MKEMLKWWVIAALVFSLNSCGLPMALARTAGGVLNSAGSLAGAASALGGGF
jgi:hypothetical protein